MTCSRLASTCTGTDVRMVKLFLRSTLRPMCAGCRAALDRAGASYSVVEPEPFRPLWRRNLPARDETGRLVA